MCAIVDPRFVVRCPFLRSMGGAFVEDQRRHVVVVRCLEIYTLYVTTLNAVDDSVASDVFADTISKEVSFCSDVSLLGSAGLW